MLPVIIYILPIYVWLQENNHELLWRYLRPHGSDWQPRCRTWYCRTTTFHLRMKCKAKELYLAIRSRWRWYPGSNYWNPPTVSLYWFFSYRRQRQRHYFTLLFVYKIEVSLPRRPPGVHCHTSRHWWTRFPYNLKVKKVTVAEMGKEIVSNIACS